MTTTTPQPADPGARRLAAAGPFVGSPAWPVGALLVGAWVLWAWLDGGLGATRWGPVGAVTVLLVAIAVAVTPVRLRRPEPARAVMLATLAAFVAWNFLSILWADVRGDAWAGADRALIYGATFAAFALWPWAPRARIALLGLFTIGIAVVAVAYLLKVALSADPEPYFEQGRLIGPTSYSNGSVALWMLAFWPAVYLGSTRALPGALRPVLLAAASVFLSLAILGQSRAWFVALPVTAVLSLVLARQRLRMVLGLVLPGVATLAIVNPLLHVFEQSQAGAPIDGPVHRAALAILLSSCLVAVAAAVWVALDRRSLLPAPTRVASLAAFVVLALGSTAAVLAAASTSGDLGGWFAARWDDLKGTESSVAASRLASRPEQSSRYEIWKIAWKEFEEHPVAGIGADNFAVPYLEHRAEPRLDVRHPHSAALRLLSQLGIVGTLLFAVSIGIAVALALRQRRRLDPVAGGACAAGLMVFVYWLLHGSVDIFWEIPALGAPAVGLLALAGASAADPGQGLAASTRGGRGPSALATAAALGTSAILVAGSAAIVLPWLSASYTDSGVRVWRTRPELAYDRLETAAKLDPLSAFPLMLEGSIAMKRGELERARGILARAVAREPANWYAHLQLGLVQASLGDYAEGERSVAKAYQLNPLERGVLLASELIRARSPIDLKAFDVLYAPAALSTSRIAFETGFEEGAVAASRFGLFDRVKTPPGGSVTVATDRVRSGVYALKVVVGSSSTYAMQYVATSNVRQVVAQFSFLLDRLPTRATVIAALSEDSPAYALFRVNPEGVLEASAKDESGGGAAWVQGSNVRPDRWYRIDARYDTSAATLTLDWMVDGKAMPRATYRNAPQATWPGLYLGALGEGARGTTVWYDDVAVSIDASAYPLTTGPERP